VTHPGGPSLFTVRPSCYAHRPPTGTDERQETTANNHTTAHHTANNHHTTDQSVLDWFGSSEARDVARRIAHRYRLYGYDAEVDTVLAEAAFAVWRRLQSPTPLTVRRPAAYGTAVIRSVLVGVIRARSRSAAALPDHLDVPHDSEQLNNHTLDLTRSQVARTSGPDWLRQAAVAYVDLAVGDLVLTDAVPQPRSGATPAQARAWAALWIAGQEQLFPRDDSTATRKARSRAVSRLLTLLADALDDSTGQPGSGLQRGRSCRRGTVTPRIVQ
jgi:hypothetical protein